MPNKTNYIFKIMEKRYFISNCLQNNPKNKLDELLQNEFRNLMDHIVPEGKLNNFKLLHDELNERYKASGGRCQPIKYSDSRIYYSSKHDKGITIFVSETYRLKLTLINESEVL